MVEDSERLQEELQEAVMELVSKHEAFGELVEREYMARFPTGVSIPMFDEVICMCQLIVGQRVLQGVYKV